MFLQSSNKTVSSNHKRQVFKYFLSFLFIFLFIFSAVGAFAQSDSNTDEDQPREKVMEGIVRSRLKLPCKNTVEQTQCDFVKVVLTADGREVNIQITDDLNSGLIINRDWKENDRVIVVETPKADGTQDYYIRDPDRQLVLWALLAFIVIVAVLVAGFRGIMALLALVLSTVVIFSVFIPQALSGGNLWLWGFVSTLIILVINQFIGHGFSKISFIGMLSGLLTLITAWILGWISVWLFRVTGGGSDNIVFVRDYVENVKNSKIDFTGLYLVGVMIGAVGAIDDVVAAQSSTVTELISTNRLMKFSELYSKSMRVGREHIVSMINTLFLAYAGTSLPLLMIFATSLNESIMHLLSREDMTEEIIRTAVGSTALLFVVPLSTFCAALFYKRPIWLENYINKRIKPLFKS
ncbi:MAG: hypothetical protein OHK0017_07330 [Patescibacteria group bacterium]